MLRGRQVAIVLNAVSSLLAAATAPVPVPVISALDASCLVPVLESHLRSTEVDITRAPSLYSSVYRVIDALSRIPNAAYLLGPLADRGESIWDLLQQQCEMAAAYLEDADLHTISARERRPLQLLVDITQQLQGSAAFEAVRQAKAEPAASTTTTKDGAGGGAGSDGGGGGGGGGEGKHSEGEGSKEEEYCKEVKRLAISKLPMQSSDGSFPTFSFSKEAAAAVVPRATLARVGRELRSFARSLPVSWASSIAVRYDAKKPFVMQAMIFGPDDTPYDSGAFLFDLYCHEGYPAKPPKVSALMLRRRLPTLLAAAPSIADATAGTVPHHRRWHSSLQP